jgi:hypothetical protein
MAKTKSTRPGPKTLKTPSTEALERSALADRLSSSKTADRLRAYLASVRQVRGTVFRQDIDERIYRGRSLIERLALGAWRLALGAECRG